jgi:hypothetical protein
MNVRRNYKFKLGSLPMMGRLLSRMRNIEKMFLRLFEFLHKTIKLYAAVVVTVLHFYGLISSQLLLLPANKFLNFAVGTIFF